VGTTTLRLFPRVTPPPPHPQRRDSSFSPGETPQNPPQTAPDRSFPEGAHGLFVASLGSREFPPFFVVTAAQRRMVPSPGVPVSICFFLVFCFPPPPPPAAPSASPQRPFSLRLRVPGAWPGFFCLPPPNQTAQAKTFIAFREVEPPAYDPAAIKTVL